MNFVKVCSVLLAKLNKYVKPIKGTRHNITLDERGRLVLSIMNGKDYIPIIIDEWDSSKESVDSILSQIIMLLKPRINQELFEEVIVEDGEKKSDN